ncbi:MAG: hypothetical protein PHX58_05495 [Desulfovibrio sp.]|jgi:hypothetical protein|nr:hypothetical protein [Desulfovibrio sp.]
MTMDKRPLPIPGALSADAELRRLLGGVRREQDADLDRRLEDLAPEEQEAYLDREWARLEDRETCDS